MLKKLLLQKFSTIGFDHQLPELLGRAVAASWCMVAASAVRWPLLNIMRIMGAALAVVRLLAHNAKGIMLMQLSGLCGWLRGLQRLASVQGYCVPFAVDAMCWLAGVGLCVGFG